MSTTLRISEKTVRRMIGRRELRAFRVGGQLRVQRDSVIDLLRRGGGLLHEYYRAAA